MTAGVSLLAAGPQQQQDWALLIGVDEGFTLPGAQSTATSLERIADRLHRVFGYRQENVFELYDEEATLGAISEVFDQLRRRMAPDDSLLFVLSLPSVEQSYLPVGGNTDQPWTLLTHEDLESVLRIPASGLAIWRREVQGGGEAHLLYTGEQGMSRVIFVKPAGFRRLSAAEFDRTVDRTLERLADSEKAVTPQRLAEELARSLDLYLRQEIESEDPGFTLVGSGRPGGLAQQLARAASAAERLAAIEAVVAGMGREPEDRHERLIRESGDALLRLARDASESDEVRHRAVWALGILRYGPSAEPLAELLTTQADPVLRLEAVRALRRIEPPALGSALCGALRDQDPLVRVAAIRAITSLRDEDSADELFEVVASDPVEDVRLFALQSLAAWGVRRGDLLRTATRMLGDASPAIRREAVGVLGDLAESASASGVIPLLHSDPDPGVRQAVAYSLVKLFREEDREELEELLAQAVEPGNPAAAREAAVWALGEIGGGEERLRAIVDDRGDEREVRLAAIEAVSTIRSVAAVEELSEVLTRKGEDLAIRRRAAEVLGEIGVARAYRPLVAALKDESQEVRAAAEVALQKIDADPLDAELREQLGDTESAQVRAEAAKLLAQRGDPAVVDLLVEALADRDYEVRESAAIGLSRFSDGESVQKIVAALGHESFLVRQGAASALGLMGPEASEVASQALQQRAGDPYGAVREAVVRALGRLRSPGSEAFVIAAVEDAEPGVRKAAAEALEGYRSEESEQALQKLSRDPASQVRVAAIDILRRITPKKTRFSPVDMASDPAGEELYILTRDHLIYRLATKTGRFQLIAQLPWAEGTHTSLCLLGVEDRSWLVASAFNSLSALSGVWKVTVTTLTLLDPPAGPIGELSRTQTLLRWRYYGIDCDSPNRRVLFVDPDEGEVYAAQMLDDGLETPSLLMRGQNVLVEVVKAHRGWIYLGSDSSARILAADASTGKTSPLIRGIEPADLAVDPDGNHLLVADAKDRKIWAYDLASAAATGERTSTSTAPRAGSSVHWSIRTESRELKLPCAVAVDSRGHLWVADCHERTLFEFPPGQASPSRHAP